MNRSGACVAVTDVEAQLVVCDREPIHVPESIQPHGLMLVVDQQDMRIRRVAGAVEQRLGVSAWQGAPLEDLVGASLKARISALQQPGAAGGFMGQIRPASGDGLLEVSAHQADGCILVEMEPAPAETHPASIVLNGLEMAASEFERAQSVSILCERAALEFRRLTGFDRVMVYQFLEDGAGRVVAEDRRDDLRSFLHHHFPAADIPRQARALYLRNPVRVIPDARYEPAALRPAAAEGDLLDLSDSVLRSVSPIHLQYLANMGVRASASISIIKDGLLWGLIACHNETPRLLPYDIRAACRALAGGLSRQLKAKEEAESYRQRIRLRGFEEDIVRLLSREGSLDTALSNHLNDVRRMLGGDGVAVLRGRELITGGTCPDEGAVRDLGAWVLARDAGTAFSTDQLSGLYPVSGAYRSTVSGLLAVTLSVEEPWLVMWFRAEKVETVEWAGNPHKADETGDPRKMLTPRASFDAWRETVRGFAQRWTTPEIESAIRLRGALLEVRQRRRLQELNGRLTDILRDKDALLRQKEFLIGEVNHRVQNSLQLVSSFLALQGRTSDNPELRMALEEARRRLEAVALVHRRLYRDEQIQMVDAARYIEELCSEAVSSLGRDWAQHLNLDLAPVTISTDRAVTLGLVLTELMININKYAYGGEPGPIDVQLIDSGNQLQLVVADRGVGKSSPRKGFGSRMMEGLVTQLGGELSYADNKPGLRAVLTAPVHSPQRVG